MQEIWIDQEDAALLQDGEEVTLMDWGNAVIEVHFSLVTPHSTRSLAFGLRAILGLQSLSKGKLLDIHWRLISMET